MGWDAIQKIRYYPDKSPGKELVYHVTAIGGHV
jgi:hypothetical protein